MKNDDYDAVLIRYRYFYMLSIPFLAFVLTFIARGSDLSCFKLFFLSLCLATVYSSKFAAVFVPVTPFKP